MSVGNSFNNLMAYGCVQCTQNCAMDIGRRVNVWLNLKHCRYAYSAYKLINMGRLKF